MTSSTIPRSAAILTLSLVLLAATAVAAPAAQIQVPPEWADEYSAMTLHAPGPAGAPITIRHEPCPTGSAYADGCADRAQSTIYLAGLERFVPRAVGFQPSALEHEIGHFFDWRNLDGPERGAFSELMGMKGRAWSDCGNANSVGEYSTTGYGECPMELFADGYAACALKMRLPHWKGQTFYAGNWVSSYGWQPTQARHKRFCRALWRFADPSLGETSGS